MTDEELQRLADVEAEPFLERTLSIEEHVENIRSKLGEEVATQINDELLNLQSEVVAVTDLHKTVVTEKLKVADRNSQLVEVNNDLYIKNSNSLKGSSNQNQINDFDDMDDDDAIDEYASAVMGNK
jgi:hypothetical protein